MSIVHVVFNPTSGSYSSRKAEQILTQLRAAGLDPQPLLPRSFAESMQAVADLCTQATPPTIIAVGGDGTVNTVINSMPQGSATLGIIPLGTANVMARELGIRSQQDAIARIARGTLRPFTVGEASSTAGVRRFVLMAGIGADAEAVADVRPSEKRLLGKGAYVLAGLRRCLDWDNRQITATCGGQTRCCNSLIIANAAHYAGPYRLVPQASLFTPYLVVAPLPFNSPLGLLGFTASVFLRGRYAAPDALSVEKESILVETDKPVQLDGDSFGTGPVTIRPIPSYNSLII
ncbi:MAG: diacylglycerol kinase family lipid kinase [Geobacteraceae bacterium]|nr:diacylglycerol kinase family lipid kinase [Geobacteraceae bacterium]